MKPAGWRYLLSGCRYRIFNAAIASTQRTEIRLSCCLLFITTEREHASPALRRVMSRARRHRAAGCFFFCSGVNATLSAIYPARPRG